MSNMLDLWRRIKRGRELTNLPYKIKQFRERRNMTQEELARKSGVSRAIISKLENEEEVVTKTSTLMKIADALNCKVGDIFLP